MISASVLPGDRDLVRHRDLRHRQLVRLGVGQQLLHRRVRVLRLALLRGLVALPLDEPAADGVVLLLEEHGVPRHELAGHGVRVREVALGRVVDDVLQGDVEGLVAQLHREDLVGLVPQAVEEERVDGRRLLAHDARERCPLRPVAQAGGAQAAEQVHLERGRLVELLLRQLRAALVEVVGDAHRADGVGARRARPHLVELVDRRHHRALGLPLDVEVERDVLRHRGRRRRGGGGLLLLGRRAAGDHRRRADDGAAHHEGAAVHARRNLRRESLVDRERGLAAGVFSLHKGSNPPGFTGPSGRTLPTPKMNREAPPRLVTAA